MYFQMEDILWSPLQEEDLVLNLIGKKKGMRMACNEEEYLQKYSKWFAEYGT